MEMLAACCRDCEAWLTDYDDNVVAIHCKVCTLTPLERHGRGEERRGEERRGEERRGEERRGEERRGEERRGEERRGEERS
jgi:hypothetical protein